MDNDSPLKKRIWITRDSKALPYSVWEDGRPEWGDGSQRWGYYKTSMSSEKRVLTMKGDRLPSFVMYLSSEDAANFFGVSGMEGGSDSIVEMEVSIKVIGG